MLARADGMALVLSSPSANPVGFRWQMTGEAAAFRREKPSRNNCRRQAWISRAGRGAAYGRFARSGLSV